MNNQDPEEQISTLPPRTVQLQTRLAASFAILAVMSAMVVTLVLVITVRNQLLADVQARVRDAVAIGALQIDGDMHATLVDADQQEGEVYAQLKIKLQNIRNAGANYRFVYTLRYNAGDNLMYFIVDAETEPEDFSPLMSAYTDLPAETTAVLSNLREPFVEPEFYTDQWGEWLTGYAPIYTSDNRLDAVLAMDVDASLVRAQTNRVIWIALGVLVLLIPLVVTAGWQAAIDAQGSIVLSRSEEAQ